MSDMKQQKIVCIACGRTGVFRPELAGKRVKCKCGSIITVPATVKPDPIQVKPEQHYDLQEDVPAPVRKLPTLAPRTNPAQTSATPQPTVKSKRHDAAAAEEKAKFIRMAVLFGVIAIVIAGAIVGLKIFSAKTQNAAPGSQLGEDAEIEEKLANETHMEIHQWYKQDPSRIAGPWTPQQAMGFADRWQASGARQVIIFGSAYAQFLVIELPTEPEKRKPIFDWQAQWHKDHHLKVWTDVGQKYLTIQLPP